MKLLERITTRQIEDSLRTCGKKKTFWIDLQIGRGPKGRFRRSLKTTDRMVAISRAINIFQRIEKPGQMKMRLSNLRDEFSNHLKIRRRSSMYCSNVVHSFNSLIEVVGDLKLFEVHKRHVEKFQDTLLLQIRTMKDGTQKNLAGQTINGHLRIYRSAFSWAGDQGYAPKENPFKGFEKVPEDSVEANFFEPEDIELILNTMSNLYGEEVTAVYILYLMTGMRLSDGLKLQWSWIDFVKQIIVFPPVTKGNRDRKVPLGKKSMEVLKLLQMKGYETPVFLSKEVIEEYWANVRSVTGIRGKFHDLRKTVNTLLQITGLSPYFCKKLLGHKTRDVNELHYSGYPVKVIRHHLDLLSDMIWNTDSDPTNEASDMNAAGLSQADKNNALPQIYDEKL